MCLETLLKPFRNQEQEQDQEQNIYVGQAQLFVFSHNIGYKLDSKISYI